MQEMGNVGEIVEMDEKGRIVIRKSARDRLELRAGDGLTVEVKDDKLVISALTKVL